MANTVKRSIAMVSPRGASIGPAKDSLTKGGTVDEQTHSGDDLSHRQHDKFNS